MRRGQVSIFIIIGLVLVIVVALTLYVIEVQEQEGRDTLARGFEHSAIPEKDCEDGTMDSQCSFERPLQCRSGVLRPNCIDCGCPTNELCNADGTCGDRAEDAESNFTFYIIPVDYAPDDREFLLRVEILKTSLFSQFAFTDANFVVVEKTLEYGEDDCLTITRRFNPFVQHWLQQQTGHGLPGVRFEDNVPVRSYRLIGIDSNKQDATRCGCGHSLIYSPNVYIGGADCSLRPHVALHELGHTVGMCDEYDTCVYDETDRFINEAFAHGCRNSKPDDFNSDCSFECCSEEGIACCNGKFADSEAEGFFNVMGSSDIPPPRRLDSDSRDVFNGFFCSLLGVCG